MMNQDSSQQSITICLLYHPLQYILEMCCTILVDTNVYMCMSAFPETLVKSHKIK